MVLAVDGGKHELPVRNGFPGAELCCITIAGVILDVRRMRQLETDRPVDPRSFKTMESASSLERFFPGCNVVLDGELSAQTSLRRAVFEAMDSVRVMGDDGETLLGTYEALLSSKSQGAGQRCPYLEDCGTSPSPGYEPAAGRSECRCGLRRSVYSTDALRIHEGMTPGGSNLAMFEEILQVLERIWVVHILRGIERNGWLRVLRRLAFVIDGPLGVFGHPAWLSEAIRRELTRINSAARNVNDGKDLLLLGIEKTGTFAQHLELLDQDPASGSPGSITRGTAMLLDDPYIKRNIIFSTSERPYGEQTYFGRKFFYKAASGALLVGSLPFLREEDRNLSSAERRQFPRLADAIALMDSLWSARYPNALIPILSAHAEAAIPLNLGRKVLERIVRQLILEERGSA